MAKQELRITFQATGGLKDRINDYADKHDLTQSEAIRKLINNGLEDPSKNIFQKILNIFGYESPQDVPEERLSVMGEMYTLASKIVGGAE